jgi:hypothetical protein
LIILNKLKLVNKRWLKLINEILKQRKPQIYTYCYQTTSKNDYFTADFKLNLIRNLKNFMAPQPDLFIYLLSQSFYSINQNPNHSTESKHNYLANISNQISSNLPSKSTKLIISGQDIIHDNYCLSKTSSAIVGGLLLPKSNSFRFITKQLINEHELLKDIKQASELYSFFGIDSNNECIRFMFILKNRLSHLNCSLEAHLSIFLDNLNAMKGEKCLEKLIVNGCTVNDAFLSEKEASFCYNKQKEITFVLLLTATSANESIDVNQIVIPGQQTQDYIIESYFKKVKSGKKCLSNYIKIFPRDDDQEFLDNQMILHNKLNQLKQTMNMANKFNLIFYTTTESKLNKVTSEMEMFKNHFMLNTNDNFGIIGLVSYNDGFIGHDSNCCLTSGQKDIRFYFEECSSFTIISFK